MEETPRTPVITIGLNAGQATFDYAMAELKNLVEANHMTVVEEVQQALSRPQPGTYFGTGKVEELATIVADDGVDTVVVNDELTPSQIRNLEKVTKARIIDRTGLILEIFANRAQSREAKLQVQLAKLQYQLPRLHTSASQRLDQQTGSGGGGGFTNRGAGESQTEISRRTLQRAITHVNHELKEINQAAATQRQQRERNQLPSVALVGYTNAGKSTLMNRLLARFGIGAESDDTKQVFEKDMLFATLNTTVRQLTLPDKTQFLLSDTVGFVSKLPHNLVAAFKSTLQEAAQADLLLQVVDISDPHYKDMMTTTENTLREVGVTNIPMVTVYNKADKTTLNYPDVSGENAITLSALEAASQDALITLIQKHVFKDNETVTLHIPFDQGAVQAKLAANHTFIAENYDDSGTLLTVELSQLELEQFKKYII